ncbi:hypothetical protein ACIRYZ_42755 [Kitasatospora sp. NPDC101155]|uniref:hypothetical protein n=1 Tax=Kitasatospora sp. NPDC101155 TaxID=3364097 RepID=UPI00381F3EA3
MKHHGSIRNDEERLTTEDLARSSETGQEPVGQDRQETETAEDRPVYPGEATGGLADEGSGTREEEAGPAEYGEAEGRETADAGGTPGERETAEQPSERTQGAGEEPLFASEDEHEFRSRWQEIQSQFVDDPQEAVRSADALVADLMQRLAASFSDHKRGLEQQWNRGGEVQTEDLRLALQQYRSFFNRLLSS